MDIKIAVEQKKKKKRGTKIQRLLHGFIRNYLQPGCRCTEVTQTLVALGYPEITNQYIWASHKDFRAAKHCLC